MTAEFQQNAVSRAVWPWVDDERSADKGRRRRRRAISQSAAMLVVAALLVFLVEAPRMGLAVCGAAAVVLISGLWVPVVFCGIDRAVRALATAVGAMLTWMLLVPFFYLAFVPTRLIQVIRGRDPMHREFPGRDTSFWIPHKARTTEQDYRKQF